MRCAWTHSSFRLGIIHRHTAAPDMFASASHFLAYTRSMSVTPEVLFTLHAYVS